MNEQPQQSVVADGIVAAAHPARTLWGMLCERVRRRAAGITCPQCDPVTGNWRDHTMQRMFAREIDALYAEPLQSRP